MLDKVKLTIKNTLIYSLGSIASKLVGFILLPYYSKYLSIEQYGTLGLMEVIVQLFINLFSLSVYIAFSRFYWDKNYSGKQNKLFFNTLLFVVFSSIMFILLLFPFCNHFAILLFSNVKYSYLLKLTLITGGLESIIVVVLMLLRLKGKSILFSTLNVSKFTIHLIFTIAFVSMFNQKVEGIYQAQIISGIVFIALSFKYIIKNIEFKFEKKILISLLLFSYPFIFSSLAEVSFTIIDKFFLKFFSSLSDVGVYTLAFRISNTIKVLIISPILLAVLPIVFQSMYDKNNKRFYSKIMTYLSFGVTFLILFISLFSKEIIKVLAYYNKDYWDSYKLIPLLAITALFFMLKEISYNGLQIAKKPKIIASITIIMSLVNIVLNYFLIIKWQTYGAAVASIITSVIYFMLAYIYAQKHYYIPYELKKIGLLLLVLISYIIINIYVNDLNTLCRMVIKTIMLISFPLVLYLFNFYEKIEIQSLKGGWKKWSNPKNWKIK